MQMRWGESEIPGRGHSRDKRKAEGAQRRETERGKERDQERKTKRAGKREGAETKKEKAGL